MLSQSITVKPRVLIMIATGDIGGPGKGVLQFLEHAPPGAFEYVLCNFDTKNRTSGQFVDEACRKNLNLELLKQRMVFDPNLIVQARRIVREHGINLIQTHGYKSNAIGFTLRSLCRLPWIGFAHGYVDDNSKNRFYNRIDRLILRGADRIVAVSDSMEVLLTRTGIKAKTIRVIHNAIDPDKIALSTSAMDVRQQHGLALDKKIIGVIGRLNPEKGQMVFLRAMEKVAQSVPKAIALIVGDGQDRELLEEFCREKGLNEHVIFLGYQENIAAYYQALDLLVQPSFSEGLPNTVLEAMGFGVPVVATAVGGVPEIIQNRNGIMVPANDPDALAEAMIALLGNDALRQLIGKNGKDSLFPRFSADHRAQKIVNLYTELLSEQAGSQTINQPA